MVLGVEPSTVVVVVDSSPVAVVVVVPSLETVVVAEDRLEVVVDCIAVVVVLIGITGSSTSLVRTGQRLKSESLRELEVPPAQGYPAHP